jgi:dihydroneopterin aldolase
MNDSDGALNTTDRISLMGLRVFGRHGLLAKEKSEGQEFVVDLVMWLDLRAAASSDDIDDTVHYGHIAELTEKIVASPARNLIETVGEDIAAGVLSDPKISAVQVTVHKPHAPIPLAFADVSVTLYRERNHE